MSDATTIKLINMLARFIDCAELSQDEIEPETEELINEAIELIRETKQ